MYTDEQQTGDVDVGVKDDPWGGSFARLFIFLLPLLLTELMNEGNDVGFGDAQSAALARPDSFNSFNVRRYRTLSVI